MFKNKIFVFDSIVSEHIDRILTNDDFDADAFLGWLNQEWKDLPQDREPILKSPPRSPSPPPEPSLKRSDIEPIYYCPVHHQTALETCLVETKYGRWEYYRVLPPGSSQNVL